MWHEPFCAPRKLAALMVVAAWTALAGQALAQRDSAPLPPGTPASPTGLRKMDYLTTVGGLPSAPGASWVQKQPAPRCPFCAGTGRVSANTPYNRGRILTRETPKGDSGVRFHTGDAVVTGASGESWPIARATFESTYSAVPGGRMGQDGKFFKKPLPVLGVQMHEPFTVTASWGSSKARVATGLFSTTRLAAILASWARRSSSGLIGGFRCPPSCRRSLRPCARVCPIGRATGSQGSGTVPGVIQTGFGCLLPNLGISDRKKIGVPDSRRS